MPLAAFIKSIGKKAVHLGGSTQILFGIKGERWDERDFFRNYTMNTGSDQQKMKYLQILNMLSQVATGKLNNSSSVS